MDILGEEPACGGRTVRKMSFSLGSFRGDTRSGFPSGAYEPPSHASASLPRASEGTCGSRAGARSRHTPRALRRTGACASLPRAQQQLSQGEGVAVALTRLGVCSEVALAQGVGYGEGSRAPAAARARGFGASSEKARVRVHSQQTPPPPVLNGKRVRQCGGMLRLRAASL
jgi:hypothetical protein